VRDNALTALFDQRLHDFGGLGWANAKAALNGPDIKATTDTKETAPASQAGKGLIHGDPGPEVEEFFCRHRNPFRCLTDVVQDGVG